MPLSEKSGLSASLRGADVVLAHDFAPASDLALEERLRSLHRALLLRIGKDAGRGPALDRGGIVEQGGERAIQLLDRRLRRRRRREHRMPVLDLELRPVLVDEARHTGKL